MTIYAYKSPERTETLKEHIKNGIYFINNVYISHNYHLYIKCRLEVFNYDYSESEIVNSVLTAYAYHDVGKACVRLQKRICEGKGAPGHEVLSAIILRKCFQELNPLTPLEKGTILAIILHMGALRGLLKSFVEAKNHLSPLPKDAIIEFNQTLDDCWPKNLFPVKPVEKDMEITSNDLHLLIKEFGVYFYPKHVGEVIKKVEKAATVVTTYLLLHPIITADEYAVCKLQGKKLRHWVQEFLNSKGLRINAEK